MIIDYILDRKEGVPYNPRDFYWYVYEEWKCFKSNLFEKLLNALDNGTEQDVKDVLCEYIDKCDYNLKICDYIKSVNWVEGLDYEY